MSKDKLALRTDNTYYGHPYYADADLIGAPALFYVTQPDKLVAGFARIVERVIAEPEDAGGMRHGHPLRLVGSVPEASASTSSSSRS